MEEGEAEEDTEKYLSGISPRNFFYSLYNAAEVPPSVRRSIYRGKNLGNSLQYYQRYNIQTGNFYDMFLGDYWEDENRIRWTIVDFDYWMGCRKDATGYPITKHHLAIMPLGNVADFECIWGTTKANGYGNADIRTFISNSVVPKALSVFGGGTLLKKSELLTDSSKYTWFDNSVMELPNQQMLFGGKVLETINYGTSTQEAASNVQLAAFAFHAPFQFMEKINGSPHPAMWLQDISKNTANTVLYYDPRKIVGTVDPTKSNLMYAVPVFGVF